MATANKESNIIFEQQYKKLNKKQKQAVDTIDGPLLVVAGPGSGKTEILSLRVGKILQKSHGISPSNILCLTFTDAAASNMRQRLAKYIGESAYKVGIYTFHSFCQDIIQKYPEYFFNNATFNVPSEAEKFQVMTEIFNQLPEGEGKHPLNSFHPEQGYVFLNPALQNISKLKREGVSPEDFEQILACNMADMEKINKILSPIFSERVSSKTINKLDEVLEEVKKIAVKSKEAFPNKHSYQNYAEVLWQDLAKAISAHNLSEFKSDNFKKMDEVSVLKDFVNLPKIKAFAQVYKNYLTKMFERGFYDFDDMIMHCLNILEGERDLRAMLQEQYQYILVDEFQDSNDPQMRLIKCLTSDVEQPNIMVVGDDDQAIYKFQGANIANILNFNENYAGKTITMVENYRSSQDILDLASFMIRKGQNRLENINPQISKELVASRPEPLEGEIGFLSFPSQPDEFTFIASEVKKIINNGTKAEEIAVLSRDHKTLQKLVPYFHHQKISIAYEKQRNVLKDARIKQIITIIEYLDSFGQENKEERDDLLPAIMAMPFWEIPRIEIWKVAQKTGWKESGLDQNGDKKFINKKWLEVMLESSHQKVRGLAEFLLELQIDAKNVPLEKILDRIIGSKINYTHTTDEEENEEL